MFAGGIDEMNKNLFAPNDQTTFFAIDPSEIMPPAAKEEMKNMFFETIANYTHGTEIDPWKKGNEKILKKAWDITTNRMKQAGWGVETSTWDGKPKLVKNPYWHTYGEPNNNDIYSFTKSRFFLLDASERVAKFGTGNWDDIEKMLNLNFDDKQGKVKIAIDKQSFK